MREKEIKGWRRSKKIALIESQNPHWYDLAAEWARFFQRGEESGGDSIGAGARLRVHRVGQRTDRKYRYHTPDPSTG